MAPDGLTLNPTARPGIKAAFYSAAFIIRAAAAEQLDIDPEEIDISNVRAVPSAAGFVGEIVLHDHLPNGAGFSSWIGANWAGLLDSVLNPIQDSFGDALISPGHRTCETSCPDCLRHYRNMNYHGLLDWRLGLSLLRCLRDPQHSGGLDGVFAQPELEGWLNTAAEITDVFCRSFPACQRRQFGSLPGFHLNGRDVVMTHSLWDSASPRGILADAFAHAGQDTTRVDMFDVFRRMSFVYQRLAV